MYFPGNYVGAIPNYGRPTATANTVIAAVIPPFGGPPGAPPFRSGRLQGGVLLGGQFEVELPDLVVAENVRARGGLGLGRSGRRDQDGNRQRRGAVTSVHLSSS